MNLIEILNKNGTGFLEGNYRISMPLVDVFEPDRNENYVGKSYNISFSLQDKNLGEILFKLDQILGNGQVVFSQNVKINDLFHYQIKLICTEHNIYPRFGKFQAFLITKFGDQNSFFK